VGNLCNLNCVICGPHNSTQWIPDYQKINPDKNIDHLKYQKLNQLEITDSESLKNIVNVHFHGGGEPLLSKHHVNLLKKIEQVKGLGDVRVYYNTNGTVRVSDSVLALWEKCKLIELYFSIDDVGSRFNYQRTGADWNEVLHNLHWYTDYMPHNHMFNVNCVWSYLNLYYLDELVDWHASSFNANRYGDPVNLIFQKAEGNFTINHLSTEAKQLLLKKFNGYPELRNLVNSLSENSDHSKFWATVDKIDQVRLTKFAKLYPEWSELIK
jgi:sulfatase maturation enzyme AslB (radical SAM superfamily)